MPRRHLRLAQQLSRLPVQAPALVLARRRAFVSGCALAVHRPRLRLLMPLPQVQGPSPPPMVQLAKLWLPLTQPLQWSWLRQLQLRRWSRSTTASTASAAAIWTATSAMVSHLRWLLLQSPHRSLWMTSQQGKTRTRIASAMKLVTATPRINRAAAMVTASMLSSKLQMQSCRASSTTTMAMKLQTRTRLRATAQRKAKAKAMTTPLRTRTKVKARTIMRAVATRTLKTLKLRVKAEAQKLRQLKLTEQRLLRPQRRWTAMPSLIMVLQLRPATAATAAVAGEAWVRWVLNEAVGQGQQVVGEGEDEGVVRPHREAEVGGVAEAEAPALELLPALLLVLFPVPVEAAGAGAAVVPAAVALAHLPAQEPSAGAPLCPRSRRSGWSSTPPSASTLPRRARMWKTRQQTALRQLLAAPAVAHAWAGSTTARQALAAHSAAAQGACVLHASPSPCPAWPCTPAR